MSDITVMPSPPCPTLWSQGRLTDFAWQAQLRDISDKIDDLAKTLSKKDLPERQARFTLARSLHVQMENHERFLERQ